jgi:cellobiose epimerase
MTTGVAAIQADPRDRGAAPGDWALRIKAELVGNILPFWSRHAIDRKNGGFYGTIGSDLTVQKESPRASVITSRILWTYSAAARLIDGAWRETADWAFDYVANRFWDPEEGGLFWMLDYQGKPAALRKQTYAQAFGIYALAEYHRLTGDAASLAMAIRLYELVEDRCGDPCLKGYLEARGRGWQALEDVRLSARDLNSPKSMNTHLHVLEAYTNLIRVWPDAGLKARLRELLLVMMDHIIDGSTGHFWMFFDKGWKSLSDHVSFGHDIEGSWLLVEAADLLGDPVLVARARKLALTMAKAVLEQGVDRDGSVFFEADGSGKLVDAHKHWWVQAEAVIGFYNAFQLSGDVRFRTASRRAWDYIEAKVIDRVHGEWYAKLTREGVALSEAEDAEAVLAGPWKCPYHNARVCTEMLERLANSGNGAP